MSIAIYPGSFDPITNGHLDIALRAAGLFEKLIIAVYDAPPKALLFTTEERLELWKGALPSLPNVFVETYKGLTVDFARQREARAMVRGLRALSDFEYEFDMALMNKKMAPEIEEVFLVTNVEFLFTSSSRIKEVWSLGRAVEDLVPPNVAEALTRKFSVLSRT